MKVLLGEDDEELAELLAHALRQEGHQVVKATDGRQALARWKTGQPDFLLLDITLPGVDGFEVCRRVRQQSMLPIVLLAARGQEQDIIRGLQLGADDYVVKPVSARQLLARMSAVLRRTRPAAGAPEAARALRVGDLALDLLSGEARQAGRPVRLTPLEFRLLYLLALYAGQTVAYAALVSSVWGYESGADADLLKTHISRLRQKLGPLGGGRVRAARGVGYALVPAAAAPAGPAVPEAP